MKPECARSAVRDVTTSAWDQGTLALIAVGAVLASTGCGPGRPTDDASLLDGSDDRVQMDAVDHEVGDSPSPPDGGRCADARSLETVATRIGARSWTYTFSRANATHTPFRGDPCQMYGTSVELLRATPDIDGALVVEPMGFSNSQVSILGSCDDAFATLACSTGISGIAVARVHAGSTVFIEFSPGDEPFDYSIHLDPLAGAGTACNYATAQICAPPLVCSNASGSPQCADVCGNGTADLGEECDDGGRVAGDGCAPDCTLERQSLNGTTCAPPTPLVFLPVRGQFFARAEGDTSISTTRDPSCTTMTAASPTLYFSFDIPTGSEASVSILGEEGFAPRLRQVGGACGPAGSCQSPGPAGGFSSLTHIIGGGVRTFAISGAGGPADQGRVRLYAVICPSGTVCPF